MADVKGGYARPTTGTFISSSYEDHKRRNPPSQEPGTDYGVAYGSTLFAAEDGVVVEADSRTAGADGRRLTIDLNDGQRVSYIHLSALSVGVGAKVKRGQVIGRTGASANGREWGVGAHVHTSLFPTHSYGGFGTGSTRDFAAQVGADNDGGGLQYNQLVADEQGYLKVARGETALVIDGLLGPATIAAIKRYQEYLRSRNWYAGAIDGVWGNATQTGHEKAYAEWSAAHAPKSPEYHTATVADIASLPNKRGLQKVADLYLGRNEKTGLDNDWGPRSRKGFQAFLNQNYGGSLATWLRAKYGYVGNDQWGPKMAEAATRADTANWRAL